MKLKQKNTDGIYISNYIPNSLCCKYEDDVVNYANTVVNLQKHLNAIDKF